MEENGVEGFVNKDQKKFGWGRVISRFYSMETSTAYNSVVYVSKYLGRREGWDSNIEK